MSPQMHPYLNNAELLDWCKGKGIHVTAYAPLGNVNPDFASALEDPVIAQIAARLGKTPAQVCCSSEYSVFYLVGRLYECNAFLNWIVL